MIAAEIAIVKPVAETFAPITIDAADAHLLDLADDFGPPDDSPLWDEMAAESAAMDRLDAGLLPW